MGVAVLGMAWLVPETGSSAGLGWVAALLMAYALRSGRGYLRGVLSPGSSATSSASTGSIGRSSSSAASGGRPRRLVFALFAGLGALQFLAIAVIDRHLDRIFDALALRSATAVVLAELLTPRLFPWHFGHTQIAFTPFVQVAGIGGAMAVSFLMFWVAEVAGPRAWSFRERRRAFLVPVAVFGVSIVYGLAMMDRFGSPRGEQQEVVIAQGHVAGAERRDLRAGPPVSRPHLRPEPRGRASGLAGGLARGRGAGLHPRHDRHGGRPADLPWVGDGSAYLVGAYSFLPNEEKFNAAFAVYPDGEVPMPYFKQVLIPFGEYMPLASYFPWLNTLNAKAGVFSAGTETKVFAYPMHREDGSAYTLKVSPLICYEDTVPALAREATQKGAELLVNITSDAWFGRSLAPHQHHLIAAFRAIENRRYLVRSTTTGLSAVVDPLGRTIARSRRSPRGPSRRTSASSTDRSPYTTWVGDRPWWASRSRSAAGPRDHSSVHWAGALLRRSRRLSASS